MNKPKEQANADFIQMTRQRWSAYNAIYHAFLIGIGYNGALWREPATGEPLPFVVGAEGV